MIRIPSTSNHAKLGEMAQVIMCKCVDIFDAMPCGELAWIKQSHMLTGLVSLLPRAIDVAKELSPSMVARSYPH